MKLLLKLMTATNATIQIQFEYYGLIYSLPMQIMHGQKKILCHTMKMKIVNVYWLYEIVYVWKGR